MWNSFLVEFINATNITEKLVLHRPRTAPDSRYVSVSKTKSLPLWISHCERLSQNKWRGQRWEELWRKIKVSKLYRECGRSAYYNVEALLQKYYICLKKHKIFKQYRRLRCTVKRWRLLSVFNQIPLPRGNHS